MVDGGAGKEAVSRGRLLQINSCRDSSQSYLTLIRRSNEFYNARRPLFGPNHYRPIESSSLEYLRAPSPGPKTLAGIAEISEEQNLLSLLDRMIENRNRDTSTSYIFVIRSMSIYLV